MKKELLGTKAVRLCLDYLGKYVQDSRAKSVHILSSDSDVIQKCLLRLPTDLEFVSIQADMIIEDDTRLPWKIVLENRDAELLLCPFMDKKAFLNSIPAKKVAGCFWNQWGYRGILHPDETVLSNRTLLQKLAESNIRVLDHRGIYPPKFLIPLLLGSLAGDRWSALHFRLLNSAFQMNVIACDGWQRNFSALMVFYAAH